ncbi:hypothetical protein PAEPH01_0444 [Pancytospora epiphaga]|nr:hypothetical protein PAEPH01_0444 [Pancytospora epiphaga]
MRKEDESVGPCVLKPHRIHNFTQLVALLRVKQEKYKNYSCKSPNKTFANVVVENTGVFNPENVIEGFLHEKLVERFKKYGKTVLGDFDETLKRKIKEMVKVHDQRIYLSKIRGVSEVETMLITQPTKFSFKDGLLFDLYLYLNQRKKPLAFLHSSYLNYIKAFMTTQGVAGIEAVEEATAVAEGGDKFTALLKVVCEFTKLRFSREEMAIEAYEGRYLWAELFILYRIGQLTLVRRLLDQFDVFFDLMSPKFKSAFLSHLEGNASNFSFAVGLNEDKFKQMLYAIVDGRAKSDGLVISSAEDYLWLKLIDKKGNHKSIIHDFSKFENPKILLMACILAGSYDRAADVLLRSDFGLVAKFFILRELCLEQVGCEEQKPIEQGFRGKTGASACRFLSKASSRLDESSSTFSLESENSTTQQSSLPSSTLLFLDFMFSIASKMSKSEVKVKFIEMLKSYGDYYEVVPTYIIKYDMFDIIPSEQLSDSAMEYHLDTNMAMGILKKVKDIRRSSKLLKLHHLVPPEVMVGLLGSILEGCIMADERVDEKIVEKYLNNPCTASHGNLRNFFSFYKFSISGNLSVLRNTNVFRNGQDWHPYKFVFEKLLPEIVKGVKAEKDRVMAQQVFRLCGIMGLSDESCNRVAKELVSLI